MKPFLLSSLFTVNVVLPYANGFQVSVPAFFSPKTSSSSYSSCLALAASQSNMKTEETESSSILKNYNEATSLLASYSNQQNQFTADDGNQGMGGGTSASKYWSTLSADKTQTVAHAVQSLTIQADYERTTAKKKDGFAYGRVMLGICAGSTEEAIQTLKEWVAGLKLPKGLLHGMDLDGVPIEIKGGVYIKYSTGGAMTFAEMRRSKRGFDALWRPGDAVLETYDGDFRGVYYNVELEDEVFRQYGVLPLSLFHVEEGSAQQQQQ